MRENVMSVRRLIVGTGLRGSVERLLHADIRADDLYELFFNMRAESGGSGLVSEVANFIAHPDLRTKGLAWSEVRDGFAFLKFRLWLSANKIITSDLPGSVQTAMRANLRRMRRSILQRQLGMNRNQTEAVLDKLLSRQVPTGAGRVSKLIPLNKQEYDVLACLSSHLKGGSLFNEDGLFEDFCRALQKQGILHASEKQALKKAKPAISLFALTKMHNRMIDLGDNTSAQIAITPDIKKNLGAFALSEVLKDSGGGNTTAFFWLFETSLAIRDYCDPGTAPPDRSPFIGDFVLTPQVRLGRPS